MGYARTKGGLTLSQMTNLDSSKTEEFADNNFNFDKKWQKVLQKGRKHCGKRRNCSLRAISPFPTMFSKDSFLPSTKNKGLLGKGLMHVHVPINQTSHYMNLDPQYPSCITTG